MLLGPLEATTRPLREGAPPRPAFRGPTFIRLLARLTDDTLPQGGTAPAERLSQWIDWTRAVVLSKVLDAKAPEAERGAQVVDRDDAEACAKARAMAWAWLPLENAITPAWRRRTWPGTWSKACFMFSVAGLLSSKRFALQISCRLL